MNTVRKHLSRSKGGGFARTFTGRSLHSLIISDVIDDPLDVIASGPTAADPSTYADALAVLEKFGLAGVPAAVLDRLTRGARGELPETLKTLPANVHNVIIGNNARSLAAAQARAEELGYRVLCLGSPVQGETQTVAANLADRVRAIRADRPPLAAPVCLLSGGETTVRLPPGHGLGGRNQDLVLAMLTQLGPAGLAGVVVLSGGTDGEDGPTDAAGALADQTTAATAERLHLAAADFLHRHDAYHFFAATGGLLKTGLTYTNVMDVQVILVC